MTPDHEHIEELLAGYVLQTLSGEDAAEADRLLVSHVPGCSLCREALAGFQELTGELALAADPAEPPDLLLPSLKTQLSDRPIGRARSFFLYAAAAVLVVAVGLAGWNFMLSSQVSTSEKRQASLSNMLNTLLKEDGSKMVALHTGSEAGAALPESPAPVPMPGGPSVMISFQPGAPHAWILGVNIPQPDPGHVYQLWLGRAGSFTPAARFAPGPDGYVQQFIPADLTQYDEVAVTMEVATIYVVTPTGPVRWDARVYP